MLRRTIYAIAIFLFAPSTRGGVLDDAFGNTIVFEYDSSGKTSELWLAKDGSFMLDSRTPHHYHGRWYLDGARLCLKGAGFYSFLPSECYTIPPPPLGLHDPSWRQMMPVGGMASVKLVAGHFVPTRH